MNKSETINDLAAALSKLQAELGPAMKADKANYGKFANLASIWDAAREPLTQNGLAISQVTKVADPVMLDSILHFGIIVETVLMHSSGQWISGECFYPIQKRDPQGVGSAITYGRRYGMSAILGIIAADDDGDHASYRKNEYDQRTGPPPATRPQPAPAPVVSPALSAVVDYIGNGEAKKKEMKFRALCTALNNAKVPTLIEGKDLAVWNSETLDAYCQSGFDTPLKNVSKEEVAVLITDLEDLLNERLATKAEGSTKSSEAIKDAQIKALTTLANLKHENESSVAERVSGGRCGTFLGLTDKEAGIAIKELSAL